MRWSLALVRALAVLALWIGGDSGVFSQLSCSCLPRDLCRPVPADHQYQVEVLAFYHGGMDWKHYDWSKVTTVVALHFPQADLVCHAHANKVRVVTREFIQEIQMTDNGQQENFIKGSVNKAKFWFLDGINLDTWSNVSNYRALIQLLRKTTDVFHQQIPGSQGSEGMAVPVVGVKITAGFQESVGDSFIQVIFNVPWSPDCPDDPCNDYVEMANSCDFFFVKSFNLQNQMWDECFAKAGAPYHQVYSGLSAYIKLGIDSRKLVMAVPWYGYDYPCQHFYEPGRCELKKIPLGGAPCSSRAGRLISYKEIRQQLPRSITGRYWDDDYKSPYYVYKVNNTYHEVWYDDPESLSLKSLIMKKLKLRGIGAWTANSLNYTDDPTTAMQTEEMWNALCPIRGKWRT